MEGKQNIVEGTQNTMLDTQQKNPNSKEENHLSVKSKGPEQDNTRKK